MKMVNVPHQPVTIERLERALAVAAYIVTRDGPKAVPIFERLERELAAMRADQDAIGRAKKLLESYGAPGGLNAPGSIEVDDPNIHCAPTLTEAAE
jgi:hypothetical protein